MKLIVNGDETSYDDDRLAGLLKQLGLAERKVAVVVNAQVVAQAAIAQHRLREGDRIDVLTLAGGG